MVTTAPDLSTTFPQVTRSISTTPSRVWVQTATGFTRCALMRVAAHQCTCVEVTCAKKLIIATTLHVTVLCKYAAPTYVSQGKKLHLPNNNNNNNRARVKIVV